ncbi:MAG: hypothetical protein MAG453_00600 [Calditrichaeota bacterium]|nr:hypothetical protein [Calditrichota bacterium]
MKRRRGRPGRRNLPRPLNRAGSLPVNMVPPMDDSRLINERELIRAPGLGPAEVRVTAPVPTRRATRPAGSR